MVVYEGYFIYGFILIHTKYDSICHVVLSGLSQNPCSLFFCMCRELHCSWASYFFKCGDKF